MSGALLGLGVQRLVVLLELLRRAVERELRGGGELRRVVLHGGEEFGRVIEVGLHDLLGGLHLALDQFLVLGRIQFDCNPIDYCLLLSAHSRFMTALKVVPVWRYMLPICACAPPLS